MAVKYNQTGIYTRALSGFGGVDFTSDDSTVQATRLPYAVNMWRDWESENGAAIETVPGYRQIEKTFKVSGVASYNEKIRRMWKARLTYDGETGNYIVVHRGAYVYVVDPDDGENSVSSLASIGTGHSCGYAFGDCFYILCGGKMWKISSPETIVEISSGTSGSNNAYIPTTYSDGEEYEQRNMLTNYFYNAYNVNKPSSNLYNYGLIVEPIENVSKELIVTGVMPGLTRLYIPETMEYENDTYTITAVKEGAFVSAGSYLKSVVAAKSVKKFGEGAVAGSSDNSKRGCFYSCTSLEFAMLHGAEELGDETFAMCTGLKRLVLPHTLTSIGSNALATQSTSLTVYYEGESTESVYTDIVSGLGSSSNIVTGVSLINTNVGKTIRIPCGYYYSFKISDDNTPEAVGYIGNYTEESEAAGSDTPYIESGIEFRANERTSWAEISVITEKYSDGSYTFVTISDEEGTISTRETSEGSYHFELYEPCEQIVKVTAGDTVISASYQNSGQLPNYVTTTETRDSKTYITSITVNILSEDIVQKKLTILAKAYESEFSSSGAGNDYTYDNAAYTGTSAQAIKNCTVAAEFDGRIFLTGNKALPNTVFYSNRNLSGANDPTYFGQLNYFNDGTGLNMNSALLSTPSFLAVIKEDDGDGAIYFHTSEITEYDVLPKIYPGIRGSAGIGSVGPCINFRDDPVFLSKMGLEGIGLSAVNSERGIYHRSSNVDRLLLAEDLKDAALCEWKGYLVLLTSGKIFLADSRQIFNHAGGSKEYEWYYLEDIGEYVGQQRTYFYASASAVDSGGNRYTDMYHNGIRFEVKQSESLFNGTVQSAYPSLSPDGTGGTGESYAYYADETDEYGNHHYYLLDSSGEMSGGTFYPACAACEVSDKLYFGTDSGNIFVFNTDKRGQPYTWSNDSEDVSRDRIHRHWYTFNGRRYLSGFATKKDDCGVPHYDKDTVRRSMVLKNKTLTGSQFNLKVRTDREDWEAVDVITATESTSYYNDFSNASFVTSEEMIYPCRESKRRWVEKQYYLYTDCYMSPFGVYYIVYRYKLSGLAGRIRRN